MNTKFFWLSIIAVIISFIGGFLVANALNRNEINLLQAENGRLKNVQAKVDQTSAELSLSSEEIRQKIAEADQNPTNFTFQKNLGIALYNYASMKQDADLLSEISRILTRVYENNPKDTDTVITLGNIYFDLGYLNKDNENFQKAQEFYQKALEQKPNDANVRTDLGLIYYLTNPPETDKAIVEFQKSLLIDSNHEKTLQVITQALLSQNKNVEAEKYLLRLKEVNPNNPTLPELTVRLKQKDNSQK
ncbi:MAG: tetratricopeptide repeat protein [Acidobacteria bacterium]|jgi:tetratricopeptide (TPR) repeat protein|nr:tetratricopeptide repeat protein [Acidobacteriota bacterium]